MKSFNYLFIALILTCLTHCNSGSSSHDELFGSITITAKVSGLNSNQSVKLNMYDRNFDSVKSSQTISSNTSSAFGTKIDKYDSIVVTVATQPTNQACTVNDFFNKTVNKDTTVNVICSSTMHMISGTVTGLAPDKTFTIAANRDYATTISGNGAFTFDADFADGAKYEVTIATPPQGQYCTLKNESGTITSDVTNVTITCENAHQLFTAYGKLYKGDFGGRAVADARCADYVSSKKFSVSCSGGLVAFMSTSSNDEIRDFPTTHSLDTSRKIYTENLDHYGDMRAIGVYDKLADDFTDLLDGSIDDIPNINYTWSGSDSSGALSDDCNDWTSASGTVTGTEMQNSKKDNTWLSASRKCDQSDFISCLCINNDANTYTLGGTVTGLEEGGSILLYVENSLIELTDNGSFTLSDFSFEEGDDYSVSISDDPIDQTCTITHDSGTFETSNISNIDITCTTNEETPTVPTYTVGGTITGLTSSNLSLLIEAQTLDQQISILSTDTTFTTIVPINEGDDYTVSVAQQPDNETCVVTNESGTNISADVTNVIVTCSANTYTVGGTISGFSSGNLELELMYGGEGSEPLSLTNGDPFTFSTLLNSGTNYEVMLSGNPVGLICEVSNGSGTNISQNITNVVISCTPAPN